MRSRHTSIAAETSSTVNALSEMTDRGELTITSCAPTAGVDQNRSRLALAPGFGAGSPAAVVSAERSGIEALSAGYRFGTTRTLQPGVFGPPPFGRTAYTSGGVRSSL